MTRSQIIAQLFSGKNFNDCISKMQPEQLQEDLRQEVILIVCELPEEKIIGLHQRKELEFFTVRIILNQVRSKTSPFAKKYRQYYTGYVENYLSKDDGLEELINGELSNTGNIGFNRQLKIISAYHPLDLQDRITRESAEDTAIKEIENLYWYNKGLIELYMKHGNYRAIEQETGIPFASCYKTIKKSFEQIKQKVAI
jgi:hypothetical protein